MSDQVKSFMGLSFTSDANAKLNEKDAELKQKDAELKQQNKELDQLKEQMAQVQLQKIKAEENYKNSEKNNIILSDNLTQIAKYTTQITELNYRINETIANIVALANENIIQFKEENKKLEAKLRIEFDNGVNKAIDAINIESARAKLAEAVLDTNISDEVTRAKSAEAVLKEANEALKKELEAAKEALKAAKEALEAVNTVQDEKLDQVKSELDIAKEKNDEQDINDNVIAYAVDEVNDEQEREITQIGADNLLQQEQNRNLDERLSDIENNFNRFKALIIAFDDCKNALMNTSNKRKPELYKQEVKTHFINENKGAKAGLEASKLKEKARLQAIADAIADAIAEEVARKEAEKYTIKITLKDETFFDGDFLVNTEKIIGFYDSKNKNSNLILPENDVVYGNADNSYPFTGRGVNFKILMDQNNAKSYKSYNLFSNNDNIILLWSDNQQLCKIEINGKPYPFVESAPSSPTLIPSSPGPSSPGPSSPSSPGPSSPGPSSAGPSSPGPSSPGPSSPSSPKPSSPTTQSVPHE